MLSHNALKTILDIKEKVSTTPSEMADDLNITFYPHDVAKISSQVLRFTGELKKVFEELKVNIVPYEESLVYIPLWQRARRFAALCYNNFSYLVSKLRRSEGVRHYIPFSVSRNIFKSRRIKPGISVIALGEQETGNLPMDNTLSFRRSSVVSILDMPESISKDSEFHEHFDTALSLFSYHMTNIIIGVREDEWVLYNFNASHPFYSLKNGLQREDVLNALIPKVAAPIRPYRFREFQVVEGGFNPRDGKHRGLVEDLVRSGALLDAVGLYPPGKRIDQLPFRNSFYQWIGKIHLDNRNGMSYGFLALQMPTKLSRLHPKSKMKHLSFERDEDFVQKEDGIYIRVHIPSGDYILRVPDVWVLTQRSGSNKTNMNPDKDLVKMGLVNGQMYLQAPEGLVLDDDYKPSFDTKVILAHAVGNAIVASISNHLHVNQEFTHALEHKGMALSHWHGYIDPNFIPHGWYIHGVRNPHVACSSPQSAIYALDGKLNAYVRSLKNKEAYLGDIHIEPHHGTNITFPSLVELGKFFSKNVGVATLGNRHLYLYK